MFSKFIHFIKYNNVAVLILLFILLLGGGAFAASDAGQAAIGGQTTRTEGVDNTLLLAADLDKINLDFKIEKIEQDVEYYYITYTFLDLTEVDRAWQYQLTEKTRKVTKKIRQDLGEYLAEEFKQAYQARIKELKEEQAKAAAVGEQKREEVTEYTGLIGKTLDLAAAAFPDYEPVKKRELPSPDFQQNLVPSSAAMATTGTPDNLTNIYNEYIADNDPDHDNVFGANDNCPLIYNPNQKDTDADGVGDACDIDQMDNAVNASSTPSVDSGQAAETVPAEPTPADIIQPDIIIPADPAPSAGSPQTEPTPAPAAVTEPLGIPTN